MTYCISGVAVDVDQPQALPALFGEAMAIFKATCAKERADIYLTVRQGSPTVGEPRLNSGVLTVLSGEGDGLVFRFTHKPLCALAFDAARAEAVAYIYENDDNSSPDCSELSEQLRVLFRMVFEQIAAARGILSLHASAIVHNKPSAHALCITGPSGAGKSTLTNNWLSAVDDSFVLNADRPLIDLHDDDEAVRVFGAPWSGSEQIFINDSTPLCAIVEVRQHCRNKIVRLSPIDGYRLLLKRVSVPIWSAEVTGAVMELIERLASRVTVYRLYCTNSPEAGRFLYSSLENSEQIPLLVNEESEKEMKIKNGFVIRQALDSAIAVPVGTDAASAQGAVMLNELGAFIWDKLTTERTRQQLIEYILSEYEIDEATAGRDLDEFLDSLRAAGALDE